MSALKKMIIKALPDFALNKIKAHKERGLVSEILNLEIKDTDIEDGYIKITIGNGRIFYGFPSSDARKTLYQDMRKYFPDDLLKIMTPENFETIYEIVSRYRAPRSIPGELTRNPSHYRAIRDPLADYRYDAPRKDQIADLFCPKQHDVFLDIGAFMGYGTMRIADYMQGQGRIIAVEADPDIAAVLRKNIAANDLSCVTVIETAVSDVQETVTFYKTSNTINSLNEAVLEKLGHSGFKEISVETRRVDEILKEQSINNIDKMNITINGGEMKALKSMRDVLENAHNMTITLAGWYVAEDGRKICDVVRPLLHEMGFEVLTGELGRVLAVKSAS